MQTNSEQSAMPAEANARTASDEAVVCKELLGCPWCGNQPIGHAMKYRNTGRVFGHKIRCETCNYERTITPPCWTEGKEQDAMDAAKLQLVEWWNSRKQPNSEVSGAGATASNDNNGSVTRQRSLD